MNSTPYTLRRQSGLVALFIVIFTTLLMTVVTVSFVQLMTKDQQQATASDLSQSAYDSAQAGVEDAKRLLLLDQACRNGTAAASVNCVAVAAALTPPPGQAQSTCDSLVRGGVVVQTGNETLLQQNAGDNSAKLDQAYTCVKISKDTQDYLGELQVNESIMVPLKGVQNFTSVTLSWFNAKDVASTNSLAIGFPSSGADVSLPRIGSRWQVNYPSLMRTQLIQTGASFTLNDFNDSSGDGKSNANTLFLYPSQIGSTSKDFALDARYTGPKSPDPVQCRSSVAGGGYACTVDIKLPAPNDGNVAARTAFLHLTALYNPANFRVQLKDSTGSIVKFSNVQPEVDSTGRANDMFRRVASRVELRGNFTYPNAEIDVTGGLCKNFSVTTRDADYKNTTTCTP